MDDVSIRAIARRNVAVSGLDEDTLVDLYKKLIKERDQLHHELARLSSEMAEGGDDLVSERGGLSNHIADEADIVVEQEKDMALSRNAESLLAMVDHALAKFENGSYGISEASGKPIGERLLVRPYARFTIEEQTAEEAKERQAQRTTYPELRPRMATTSVDEE
jgi:DnaK suppressor protein